MSARVRLYNINSPNNFTVSIKKGDSAYPLLGDEYSGYSGNIYSGGTTQLEIIDFPFEENTQYWIRLIDNVVNGIDIKRGFINENLYIEGEGLYSIDVNTLFIHIPNINITPTPTPMPSVTPSPTLGSYLYISSFYGYVTSADACEATVSRYLYSNTDTLATGVTIYSDSILTTPYNGQDLWIKIKLVGTETEYLILLGTDGIIIEFEECLHPTPTPTPTVTPTITPTTTLANLIGCTNYGVGFNNRLPGAVNVWEADVYLPISVPETYSFTIDFVAQRTDEYGVFYGTIIVYVYGGNSSGTAELLSPFSNVSSENWNVTSYQVVGIYPDTGLFDFIPCN